MTRDAEPRFAAVATLLGPANCEAATGHPWRAVISAAKEMHVPVFSIGERKFVPVAAFLAALEKRAAAKAEPEPEPEFDPERLILSRLGRRG